MTGLPTLSVPLLPLFNPFDVIPKALRWAMKNVFSTLAEALINVVMWFVAGDLTRLLLLLHEDSANPAAPDVFPQLNTLYDTLVPVFFLLVVLGVVSTASTAMVFSGSVSVARMSERYLVAIIGVVIVGPLLWRGVFAVHNAVGTAIWAAGGGSGFQFALDSDVMGGTQSVVATITLGLVLLFVSSSILISVLLFYIMLGARLVILALTYALTPIIGGLWASDVGVLKYGAFSMGLLVNFTVVLLILGLLMAAVFSTGGALVAQQGGAGAAFTTGPPADQSSGIETPPGTNPGNEATETGAFAGAGDVAGLGLNLLFPTMVWLGTIWLNILAVGGLLGGVTTGGASPLRPGTSGRLDRDDDDGSDDAERDGGPDADDDGDADTDDDGGDRHERVRTKAITGGAHLRRGTGTTVQAVGKQLGSTNLTKVGERISSERPTAHAHRARASIAQATDRLEGTADDSPKKSAQHGYSQCARATRIAGAAAYGATETFANNEGTGA
jgi:hypothetical protein